MTEVRIIAGDELPELPSPAAFVDAVRDAYIERGNGAPAEPRTALVNDEPAGILTTYGAVLPELGTMGGYMYSAGFGSADAWFLSPLFDVDSGELIALVDGAAMNPYKTGAVGGVAVDALSREDSSVVGVFGSGAQARGQLKATATVRDLTEVRVFSPTAEHREAFAEEMDDYLDTSVVAAESADAVLEDVDIVITATDSKDPVFDGGNLPDGAHVTAMGQYHPAKRELDEETIRRATYVPDLRARVTQDAGSFIQAKAAGAIDDEHVHDELGAVLAGTAPGRTSPDEITVFDSGGTAIETVAGATLLYERAVDQGLGTVVEFDPASTALTGKQV